MRVALLEVELFIPFAHSLKEKRMVVGRGRRSAGKFNVAVAEVAHQDVWQRAELGIVAISTSAPTSSSNWRPPRPRSIASNRESCCGRPWSS